MVGRADLPRHFDRRRAVDHRRRAALLLSRRSNGRNGWKADIWERLQLTGDLPRFSIPEEWRRVLIMLPLCSCNVLALSAYVPIEQPIPSGQPIQTLSTAQALRNAHEDRTRC